MIKKSDVIRFFDDCAPVWDAELVRSDEKIACILDNAQVTEGCRVLDVACGTGVLIPDYLRRNVQSVTGVDISEQMIRIAARKFQQDKVRFICGDVEAVDVGRDYDAIVVYNAFPHFPDPVSLIAHLAGLLKVGGTLTVAHGMSREKIDAHHHGSASKVSVGLMEADKLAEIFSRYLDVTVILSNEGMYQVAGKRTA